MKKEAEEEITIEEIRRVEELVDRLVKAAKEYAIEMYSYEEYRKDLLGVLLEHLKERKESATETFVTKMENSFEYDEGRSGLQLTKDELAPTQLQCGELDQCLLHGFNCVDCPHIPEHKRVYDPYSGEKTKKLEYDPISGLNVSADPEERRCRSFW